MVLEHCELTYVREILLTCAYFFPGIGRSQSTYKYTYKVSVGDLIEFYRKVESQMPANIEICKYQQRLDERVFPFSSIREMCSVNITDILYFLFPLI